MQVIRPEQFTDNGDLDPPDPHSSGANTDVIDVDRTIANDDDLMRLQQHTTPRGAADARRTEGTTEGVITDETSQIPQ